MKRYFVNRVKKQVVMVEAPSDLGVDNLELAKLVGNLGEVIEVGEAEYEKTKEYYQVLNEKTVTVTVSQ